MLEDVKGLSQVIILASYYRVKPHYMTRPMAVLKLIYYTRWLPLTTERSRVALALLFSQNKHTSRISAGRVSVSPTPVCEPKMIEEPICNSNESTQWLIINNSTWL